MLDCGMRFRPSTSMFAASLLLGFCFAACKPDKPSSPGDVEAPTCTADDCGPPPGMPNTLCPDGVTMSGPGECVPSEYGCAWEIVSCPSDTPDKPDKPPVTCGGIGGIQCPDGQTCVDDPNDTCDPEAGGADCGGVCQAQH